MRTVDVGLIVMMTRCTSDKNEPGGKEKKKGGVSNRQEGKEAGKNDGMT